MNQKESATLVNNIFENKEWAIIIVSSQVGILQKCDRIYLMQNGTFIKNDTYQSLSQNDMLSAFIN
jgi:ABC-type transport system involved in cytochrome bd biosynthesis fused ATPase/permease subunit